MRGVLPCQTSWFFLFFMSIQICMYFLALGGGCVEPVTCMDEQMDIRKYTCILMVQVRRGKNLKIFFSILHTINKTLLISKKKKLFQLFPIWKKTFPLVTFKGTFKRWNKENKISIEERHHYEFKTRYTIRMKQL